MADTFQRGDFVAGYLAEAEEHLQSAGKNLLRIEQELDAGEPQPRLVRELFRSLHTLKGLSAMVGIEPIVQIAHEMETILRTADRTATPLSASSLEVLLSGLAAIQHRVRAYGRSEAVAPAPGTLLASLHAQASGTMKVAAKTVDLALPPHIVSKLAPSELEELALGVRRGQRAVMLEFVPSAERAQRGISITSVRESVGAIAEIVKVLPGARPKTSSAPGGLVFTLLLLSQASRESLAEAASTELDAVLEIAAHSAPEPELSEFQDDTDLAPDRELEPRTIRVDVARLDDALEHVSNLVVSRFRMARALMALREQGADVREAMSLLQDHEREMRHLRAAITRARMISVSQLLERMPLLVRGMAKSSGKQVKLEIDAGQSELDKGVAERIFPALLHLVRNAVDHAIETPEQRARHAKPAHGLVVIRAFERDGNQLELTVSDDGAGIDRARVAHKAGRPLPVDDAALLALITLPGLSTNDVATERSGRGMGMDIVRRVTNDLLGGELGVQTELHVGTTFRLCIPLSISLLDAISFRCGDQTFVAPLASIEEIVELSDARISTSPAPGRTGTAPVTMLRRRDVDIPLFDLRSVLGLVHDQPGQSAVVVRRGERRFAFAVDRMLAQQELVIKPLEDPLVKTRGISGTTDLGDGRPTLVLDMPRLTDVASERASARAR